MNVNARCFVKMSLMRFLRSMFATSTSLVSYERTKPNTLLGVYDTWGIHKRKSGTIPTGKEPVQHGRYDWRWDLKPISCAGRFLIMGVVGVWERTPLKYSFQLNLQKIAPEIRYDQLPVPQYSYYKLPICS